MFVYLLAHSDAGGGVCQPVVAIAAKTGLTAEAVRGALEVLEGADPASGTDAEDGRRLLRPNPERDEWDIVNHAKYRGMRDDQDRRRQNREAQARWRISHGKPGKAAESPRQKSEVRSQKSEESTSTPLADSDESTVSVQPSHDRKSVIEAILGGASVKSQDKSEWEEGFREDFWKLYPRKVGKPGAIRAWHRLMPDRLDEQQEALDAVCSGLGRWIEYWREHETPEDKIPYPATFLNDHRHEDFPS